MSDRGRVAGAAQEPWQVSPGRSGISTVAVATDRSPTGDQAAQWAAEFAGRFEATLALIQVIVPQEDVVTVAGEAEAALAGAEAERLAEYAASLAGPKGIARLVVDADPAAGIVRAAEEVDADVLIVGNAGMSGRKEFLLGNVPNRVSHSARSVVIIVNTTTGEVETTPRRVRLTARKEEVVDEEPGLLGRAARIGRVMGKYGLKELFSKADPDDHANRLRQARALRSALEELGPTFAKLGQVLSTRPDLLPQEFIAELATLRDNVPPMPEPEVVKVMEEELGVPWEDVFESIEPEPMAAGTIAQVHRATLTGGERVVVKAQRHGAREEITNDLGLLELFAEKTSKREGIKEVIDTEAVFRHLSDSLHRELDFRQEAANVDRMRSVLSPYPRLDVPGIYGEISTSRLLVMEEIQGIPIGMAPEGPERKEAAYQLVESYYRQILVEGFFHADPHPGNLMWWNDKIYFLDFGMVGEIGPEMREELMLLLMAFWQEDADFLTSVTLSLAGLSPNTDFDQVAFRNELDELMAAYRHSSLEDIQLGAILQSMTEISLRHHVPLPASLTLTGKALAQMQFVTADLDPTIDPFEVAGRFLMRNLIDQIRGKADAKKLYFQAQKFRVRASNIVEALERLVGAKPGPRPSIDFRAVKLEEAFRRAGRHFALGVTAAAALLGAAITGSSTNVGEWVPAVFGLLGAGLTTGLVVDMLRKSR